MAQFKADGIDGLALTVQEIAEIPEDVKRQMLTAGGEVAAEAQRRKIRALGLVDTGKLAGSITVKQKLYVDSRKNNAPAVLVLPSGSRGKPVVRKPRKKAHAAARPTMTSFHSGVRRAAAQHPRQAVDGAGERRVRRRRDRGGVQRL